MGWTPYEVVVRLIFTVAEHWTAFDGQAALKGVDPLELPFDRLLNAIYAWLGERVKDHDQFEYQLTRPIPGRVVEVTEEMMDEEGRDFMAFAGALGVAPGGSGRIGRPIGEAGGA